MLIAMRIWSGASAVLIVVFLSLAFYYLAAAALGVSHEDAMALGLLPRIDQNGTSRLDPAMLGLIDWWAVAHIAPTIAAVVLLNLIGMLLNTSGVELATRADVDENRELRVTGLANIVIGALGGLTCYIQGGATVIADKLRVSPRAFLIGHAGVLVCAIFAAPLIVSLVPTFIPAAMLMFIGLSMLQDWLLGTRRRLTLPDWLIVVAIVLATMILGILSAIGIGLLLAVLGFAYASIRLPILRLATDIAQRPSVRDWSVADTQVLQREGHRARILHLQGPLFFGSVEQLISHLRRIAGSEPRLNAVILDFTEVLTFDSAACAALDKLLQILSANAVTAHVTGLSPGLDAVFRRWGLPMVAGGSAAGARSAFVVWGSLDAAIEHAEAALLAGQGGSAPQTGIAEILADLGRNHPRAADLMARMQRQSLAPGQVLIRANETSGDVYFLASGCLAVDLPKPALGGIRVRTMAPGAIVGEIAYLTGQPRNADVICVEAAEVWCLTADTIRRIEAEDRDLAALMLAIFGRSLAVKLGQTNSLLTHSHAPRHNAAGQRSAART